MFHLQTFMSYYKGMEPHVNKAYPGIILSQAMHARDTDAPPVI